jgi:hypothetical protein
VIVKPRQRGDPDPLRAVAPRKKKKKEAEEEKKKKFHHNVS